MITAQLVLHSRTRNANFLNMEEEKKKQNTPRVLNFSLFFNFIMAMISRIPAICLYPQGDLT